MKYFLIAGEPSGDLHGSNLMRGLKAHDPEAEFRFWGGDKMAEVGGKENLGLHYKESSYFGFVQVLIHLPQIMSQMKRCKQQIEDFQPDVVILIDYAGFNLRIAEFAKKQGFTTYFYIAPKVWAWDEKRVKKIQRTVDELFVIFPFETTWFGERGVNAYFEGNPLVDAIEARRAEFPSREDFVRQNGLNDKPIIALVAGSRSTEIKANLPLMSRVAALFPDYQFVVAGVDWLPRSLYDKNIWDNSIKYIEGQTYELLSHSEAAIVTSGTATLETALLNIPQVVLFRVKTIFVILFHIFVKIPFISLVNINLGREAVRELLISALDPTPVADALRDVACGGKERERVLEDYRELKEKIGEAGASERFARRMVELLKAKKK